TPSETEQPRIKFTQDGSALVKSDQGVSQPQRPISIQSIGLDHEYKARERVVNILPHPHSSRTGIHWTIPQSAVGSMFVPSCLSASTRVFRSELRKIKRAIKKSKKKKGKKDTFFVDKTFSSILILSSPFSKLPPSYSRFMTTRFKTSADFGGRRKTPDYTQELPLLRDVSETLLSPIPSASSVVPEPQWSERPPRHPATLNKVVLNIATLPELPTLPRPVLPRRHPKHIAIALIRTTRKLDPDAHVLRGEGFKTIAATRYETIIAMTTLAIINCQVYGRNALSL
ncbi:hypothetical protein A6R68_07439, partial [Neotoma lepida]